MKILYFLLFFSILTTNISSAQCVITISPDLPLIASNGTIDSEMDLISQRYSDAYLGLIPPTSNALTTATNSFNALNISVVNGMISGNTISSFSDLTFLKTFAKHLKFNPTDTIVAEMARNAIWLAGKQFCDGNLNSDINGYSYRHFVRPAIFLKAVLTTEIIDLFKYVFYTHHNELAIFWEANFDEAYQLAHGAINTDLIYNQLDPLLGYAVFWQDTPEERYRCMLALKRYLNRFFSHSYGTTDGIKKDGSGFHHWTAYNNYMYAYLTAIDVLSYLKDTQFQVDKANYLYFRDAIMAQYVMTNNNRIQPLSVCGRKPYERLHPQNNSKLESIANTGGSILSLTTADTLLAGLYNRLYGGSSSLNYTVIGQKLDGFFQFNYAHAGVFRKDNWLACSKGFSNNMWGAEIYPSENRYGRYQSYGALEIIYPGNIQANGFGLNTWDWNFNPGTTVIRLPWTELHAERSRIDELQQKRFVGTLAFDNQNADFLNKNSGRFGLFGMDFQERNNLGWGTVHSATNNHNASFTFKKSVFYFEDIIVCLGSDISNDDSNNPTVTTLYQRLYNNGQEVMVNNMTQAATGLTTFSGNTNHWLISNYNTGFYVFQDNHSLTIKKETQQTPNHNQIDPTLYTSNPTGTYCIGYLDHGTAPNKATYEYIIQPQTDSLSMDVLHQTIINTGKPYQVHQKDSIAHIVEYMAKDIWGYVFFDSISNLSYNHIKAVDDKCLLMHQYNTNDYSMLLSMTNPDLGLASRSNTAAIPKTIQVSLNGEWYLEEAHPNVSLVTANATETIFNFYTEYGLPIEILLKAGSVSCPAYQSYTGAILSGIYQTRNLLFSDGLISAADNITFQSNEILLENGFEVELGGVFSAEIDACDTP